MHIVNFWRNEVGILGRLTPPFHVKWTFCVLQQAFFWITPPQEKNVATSKTGFTRVPHLTADRLRQRARHSDGGGRGGGGEVVAKHNHTLYRGPWRKYDHGVASRPHQEVGRKMFLPRLAFFLSTAKIDKKDKFTGSNQEKNKICSIPRPSTAHSVRC